MNELSLFSGAGGGLLGTHCLLGWRTIGYVEINDYCQRIIAQRIKDGYFDEAPIFGDIKTFISEGYGAGYQGMVDVVTAGFPCQPFSVAGKQRGQQDERNLWPETREVIRLVRPRYILLENVPGLLAHQYFGTILYELAESGYRVRWRCLSAAEVGAPHKRDRVWILADNSRQRTGLEEYRSGGQRGQSPYPLESKILPQRDGKISPKGIDANCQDVAHSKGTRARAKQEFPGKRICSINGSQDVADSAEAGLQEQQESKQQSLLFHAERGSGQCGKWWSEDPADGSVESRLGRVAHGMAHRVDRLKAIGEGQVSAVVKTVWELLSSA